MAKHPVPKKKTSKARRDARRSHHALTPPTRVPMPAWEGIGPTPTLCPPCQVREG
jgi:large subunit ribosomal protein L32